MSEMNREQFAQHVMEVVRARFPLVKLAKAEQPFAVTLNGHVASLENLYRMSLLRQGDLKHAIERWAVELLRAGEGSPDAGAPLDRIRERILPMVLSQSQLDAAAPGAMVGQPLVASLHVVYTIDSDRTIAYVPRAQFDRWDISVDDLHEIALGNLVSRSEAIAAHAAQDEDGRINLIIFQTMDGFDASRVLLPTLHDRLREHLGSPFAAGIPNRDILLCFRNDDETVERLRGQIATDFGNMPHQVTDKILLIAADGIAPRD